MTYPTFCTDEVGQLFCFAPGGMASVAAEVEMGFVPPTLTVRVPDNCEPGQTIQIQSSAGVTIHVACPMDCGPGSTFEVVNPDAQGSAQLVVPANTLPLPAGASWDGMAPGAPPRMSMDRENPQYIGGAGGEHGTIMLRDDGRAEWHDACRHVVLTPKVASARFVSVSTGKNGSVLVRDDGAYEWMDGCSKSEARSKSGVKYVSASHFEGNLIALREDGVVEEFCCWQQCAEFQAKPSKGAGPIVGAGAGAPAKYVWAQSGPCGHLLVRDDGAARWECDSTNCCCACFSEDVTPPAGVRFVASSVGAHGTLLLRDDGAVTHGTLCGETTLSPPPGVRYVSISSHDAGGLLVRSDGNADRVLCCPNTFSPKTPGARYVSGASGKHGFILIRDDGQAHWTDGCDKNYPMVKPI